MRNLPQTDLKDPGGWEDGMNKELSVITKIVMLYERIEELERVLRALYEEQADYIRINHLGAVHHNKTMQDARDVLAKGNP